MSYSDNPNIRGPLDSSKFACTQKHEVDGLVKELRARFPGKTEAQIRAAIDACCKTNPAPRPRVEFEKCVTSRL